MYLIVLAGVYTGVLQWFIVMCVIWASLLTLHLYFIFSDEEQSLSFIKEVVPMGFSGGLIACIVLTSIYHEYFVTWISLAPCYLLMLFIFSWYEEIEYDNKYHKNFFLYAFVSVVWIVVFFVNLALSLVFFILSVLCMPLPSGDEKDDSEIIKRSRSLDKSLEDTSKKLNAAINENDQSKSLLGGRKSATTKSPRKSHRNQEEEI